MPVSTPLCHPSTEHTRIAVQCRTRRLLEPETNPPMRLRVRFFFFFLILRRMGERKGLAHHTSSVFSYASCVDLTQLLSQPNAMATQNIYEEAALYEQVVHT